ncbi:MAG: serine/threonine-protein kinase [Kofleriaceae bacterium]
MAGTATTDRLYSGDRIGNYRVEIEISTSARASEYRAVHLVLPRRAVIKVMHGDSDQPLIVNMLREACILDALHHPGIIRVYESGLHEGRPWFATELVEGPTIKNLLSPGAIDRSDAIALLRDLAEVLEHAYRRGIIHCGIRPERILMTGRTRGFPICIADWSDARAHDARPQQYAPNDAAWHYTSPELACGDPIDGRADVFAVGVLAYQMLTGQMPFDRGILGIVDDGTSQFVQTELHCPDLPSELTRLVDSMLAYDRWDRPSAAEVFTELCWIADSFTAQVQARPAAAGMLRIRRPRWTPALDFHPHERAKTDTELTVEVSEDD